MRAKNSVRAFLFFAVISATAAGCSSDSKHGRVSGRVTLDGQPLKTGLIRFVPADGRSATADGPITDGNYAVMVPPGDKRVVITAPKVVGKKKMYDSPDSPVVDIVEELLPARYNVQSELKLTVNSGSQEAPAFELKNK